MAWWQLLIFAWGMTSVVLLAVLSTCFRAATGYDTWWHTTVSRACGEELLREVA
jgi:hypothetical protein